MVDTQSAITESWRPVVGYSGYSVSDFGRIHNDTNGRVRSPRKYHGYCRVNLSRRFFSVHSLVLAAFVGPRPDGYEINHKNGVKDDNRLENLEYVTRSENSIHARRVLGRIYKNVPCRGCDNASCKLSDDKVRQIRYLASEGMFHRVIAGLFGIRRPTVSLIVNFKLWKHVT